MFIYLDPEITPSEFILKKKIKGMNFISHTQGEIILTFMM